MKNEFNISSAKQGVACSLCQDTLLRHIGDKSRVYWYCPSCRQETQETVETVGKAPDTEIVAQPSPPQPLPHIASHVASQDKYATLPA